MATLLDTDNARSHSVETIRSDRALDTSAFDAWLVDLDGTLYRQQPVRLAMAAELCLLGTRHLRIISRFRREQELLRAAAEQGSCPYRLQISRTAKALALDDAQVSPVISEWMERRPGKWLRLFRRQSLLSKIAAFRKNGGRTALVSDYPARQKLAALDAQNIFEIVVACGEPGGPTQLKPSPEGYLLACEQLGVEPSRCLVIGDRDDADGRAAQSANMAFLNIHRMHS